MKNNRKILSLILAFTLGVSTPITVNATESVTYTVLTENTLSEIINYAKSIAPSMLIEYFVCNLDSYINDASYTLGNPINIQEFESINRIYHFPIMENGNIFAILSIYDENGSYSSQIEANLMAEQLKNLQDNDTLTNVKFNSNENGFFAIVQEEIIPLTPDSEIIENPISINALTSSDDSSEAQLVQIDICSPICTIEINEEMLYSNITISRAVSSKVLNVKSVPQTDDGTFSGTQMGWCGAAVTAALINYKKGTTLTAKSVTIEALGAANNTGLTNNQVIAVAKKHGLSPLSGEPFNYSSVQLQITANQPIYMQMQRTKSDNTKSYHALGLIGYSSTKYTVINPWYQNSFTIDKKDTGTDVTYITGDRTYKWYKTIYNWK